jgi:hypothetical protein
MILRMKTCLASFLLTVLLSSAMASAQTMEFACPDPGTIFAFDSGTQVVARGRDGMACSMDLVGGTPFKMNALMIANPSPDGADTSAFIAAIRPERLWPLQVGKKIEARYNAGGQSWDYILTVARYEKRTGPGDALIDTFLIEMNETGGKGERSISRWWISPADKYAIRFDYSDGSGRANRALVTSVSR